MRAFLLRYRRGIAAHFPPCHPQTWPSAEARTVEQTANMKTSGESIRWVCVKIPRLINEFGAIASPVHDTDRDATREITEPERGSR